MAAGSTVRLRAHRPRRHAELDGARRGRPRRYGVALRWTALDPGRTAERGLRAQPGANWSASRRRPSCSRCRRRTSSTPTWTATSATRRRAASRSASAATARWPLPGWTSENGLVGLHPVRRTAHPCSTRREGYIVTANNAVVGPRPTADARLGPTATAAEGIDWICSRTDRRRRQAHGRGHDRRSSSTTADANAPDAPARPARGLDVDGDAARRRDLLADWDFSSRPRRRQRAGRVLQRVFWRHLLDACSTSCPPTGRPEGGDRWFEVVGSLLAEPVDRGGTTTTRGRRDRGHDRDLARGRLGRGIRL